MLSYKKLGTFHMRLGEVILVENDKDRQSFDDLIGKDVLIDDVKHTVYGVEAHMSTTVFKGDTIGLLISRG